jgi:hypothetical protein
MKPQLKDIKNLNLLKDDFPGAQFFCVCQVENKQKWGHVHIISWNEAFKAFGL